MHCLVSTVTYKVLFQHMLSYIYIKNTCIYVVFGQNVCYDVVLFKVQSAKLLFVKSKLHVNAV